MGSSPQEHVTLLTDYDRETAYSHAYHTLYANIRFDWNSEQSKPRTLLFAIPASYPGQTVVAANVAIAAAQNGMPTILIDADLHSSRLQQSLGRDKNSGLSNLLTGETITPQSVISHLHQTFVPDLSLLGSGTVQVQPHEASRLISSKLPSVLTSLYQALEETASQPGLIIFNSPPVLTSIDAAQISTQVEQTFLVIASGRTTRSQARRAQEQLQRAHANLTGVVMLDV